MGNLITKVTTNNLPLDESNVSDITICDVIKQKTPPSASQKTSAMLRILSSFDPRSPSAFIHRTPIAMFRNNSRGKFIHQELNESIETQVDIEILTQEEEESLGSTSDIFADIDEELSVPKIEDLLDDPRSPITEIHRTPIVATETLPIATKAKKEDPLVKKLAEKLIAANIAADAAEANKEQVVEPVEEEKSTKKNSKNGKNFVFEDETENLDRFSTPPKAKPTSSANNESGRTPLSSLNNSNKPKSRIPTSSTPKSKFHNKAQIFADETDAAAPNSSSKIPRSRRLQQQVEGM